ncbi:hypothetical protein FQA39_LY15351 [Lamprigera yunnana]|nr:hypothetical protein FQA39_LY15351 [Lamprigera yunnana]
MLLEYTVLALSILATVASQGPLDQSPKEESSKKYILPAGPPIQYSPEYYPSNGNEFQFNYVPNKEFYPGGQPPIFVYGGAGVPGQQFLYRPGSPPGNFLIPQPGPGVMFGQPQPPVFNAGYPRPAHIPPIEKDAEEVPSLAGNHHPTRTGKPDATAPYPVGPTEKIETLDETVSGEEVDDLAQAEKTPNNYPKKVFPPRPVLRPGQQFFILNGNTLFSNVPLEQDTLNQRNQKAIPIPNYYPLYQPQFIHQPELGPSQVHQEPKKESGNYVSLNNVADFRQDLFLRQQIPYIAEQPQVPLQAFEVPNDEGLRLPKNLQYDPNYSTLAYPYFVAYDYRAKEDEDTVTIEAKPEETNKRLKETSSEVISDEPSISQVKPSALAVAGVGGTSSANPKGTALVGNNGIAVASPEATAVAGPPKEESEQQKPKKEKESA